MESAKDKLNVGQAKSKNEVTIVPYYFIVIALL